jgi:hypothetical protein
MNRYPFPDRLAAARRMLARQTAPVSVHQADQIDAATSEVQAMAERLGLLLPLLAPDRAWFHRHDDQPSTETRAYLLAGVLGCTDVCPHLRRGGPQPGIVRLPLGRIDCTRCVQTLRKPPDGHEDRCDLCGRHETVTFVPFAVRQGPALIAGDVCTDCAAVLGILRDAA